METQKRQGNSHLSLKLPDKVTGLFILTLCRKIAAFKIALLMWTHPASYFKRITALTELLYPEIATKKMGGGAKSHTYLFVLPQKLPILAEKTLLIISCGGELAGEKEGEMHFWSKQSVSPFHFSQLVEKEGQTHRI